MTYEEAIKNINALNAVCGQKDLYDTEFENALALAIDALEKQIPKKPIIRKPKITLGMRNTLFVRTAKKLNLYLHNLVSVIIVGRQLIGRQANDILNSILLSFCSVLNSRNCEGVG